ncbi:hypothetical protein GCM10009104_29150 [Marinobacterium maritimum]|uniref:Lipoprotein n=1 Tax=Marinobacterium maritimum TaxID=500162 RepID=A0ABP3TFW0_9GAMM
MKRYLAPIAAALLLSACSSDVEFSPQTGEDKAFWIWSHTEAKIMGRYQEQQSRSLMRYRVEETSPNLRLTLTPEYMEMKGAGSRFNSLESSQRDPELRRMMQAGFELTLNAETGQLQTFRGRDPETWQMMLERGGQQMVEQLSRGLTSPGVMQSLPTQMGAQVALPDFQGQPATLTVAKVTDTHLVATLESESPKGKVYGELTLSRDRGWLEQLLLVVDSPLHVYGQEGRARTRVLVLPEQQVPSDMSFMLNGDFEEYWDDIWHPPEGLASQPPVTAAQLFAHDRGFLDEGSDSVALKVIHEVPEWAAPGRMSLRNVRALDAQGQTVPLQLADMGSMGPSYREGQAESYHQLLPLGWDQETALERVDAFKAELVYRPELLKVHAVNWTPGVEQTLELDGLKVSITPVAGMPLQYDLRWQRNGEAMLMRFMDGLEGRMQLQQPKLGPDWLTPGERNLLNGYSNLGNEEHWRLQLDAQPGQVNLYVLQPSPAAELTGKVTFVMPKVYRADPTLPPLRQHTLYGDRYWGETEETEIAFDPAQLAHLDETGQGALVNLPSDWDASCVLSVTAAEPLNGHVLEWQPVVDAYEQDRASPRLRKQSQYRLSTDDGEQQYFYGRDVSSRLSCSGEPQWQNLELSAGAHRWLIPVQQLPEVDLQMPVRAFMQQYRFFNDQGEALGLLDDQGYPLGLDQRPLQDVLVGEGQLRLGGHVSRVARLQQGAEPIVIDWTHSFPPLP